MPAPQQATASPKWAVQAPDGKVIQFPDQFTDADVTREMTKMYPPPSVPTESMAAAKPPTAPLPNVNMQTGPERSAQQFKQIEAQSAGPMNTQGIGPPLGGVAVPSFIGGMAGGVGGAKLAEYAANKYGVDQKYLPWIKDAAGLVGGMAGAGAGHRIAEPFKGWSIESPDQINLKGGFKLNRNLPPSQDEVYEQKAQDLMGRQKAQDALDRTSRVNRAALERQTKRAADEAEASRNQHAQDLMNRQAQQDKLDAQEAKSANAAARARREALAARDQAGQDLMNRQAQQDALDRQAQKLAKQAQASRDQLAQDRMNRQAQQDALDAKHAQSLKQLQDLRQQELAANEKFKTQHGQDLMNRQAQQDKLNAQATPKLPWMSSTEQAEPAPRTAGSNLQDIISRTKKIVIPDEEPAAEDLKRAGDFTQAPLQRLQLLAKFGDKLAQNELSRRLKH